MKIIYLDMDGTIASWEDFNIPKSVFEKPEFYLDLEPCKNVIDAIKIIIKRYKDVEIRILSAAMNEESIKSKNKWLDMYLPEITKDKRHFIIVGEKKTDFIDASHPEDYILIDDYTTNLLEWKNAGGLGIKFLNGDNGLNGKWTGDFISYRTESETLARTIHALATK